MTQEQHTHEETQSDEHTSEDGTTYQKEQTETTRIEQGGDDGSDDEGGD